jgi:hypothetical protein
VTFAHLLWFLPLAGIPHSFREPSGKGPFPVRDHFPTSHSADPYRQVTLPYPLASWVCSRYLRAPDSPSTDASYRPFQLTRGPCLGSSPPANHLSASRLAGQNPRVPPLRSVPGRDVSLDLSLWRFSAVSSEQSLGAILCEMTPECPEGLYPHKHR